MLLGSGASLAYDWLILATGARHSYFGRDDWAAHAPGLKTIEDATAVRRKVLLALERAETETDKARRQALLTFVVIGGGPTGVEMAGAIAELARKSVSRDFRSITPHCSRVILIEGGPRLLAAFPESLSAKAKSAIEALGVEVRLDARVTAISRRPCPGRRRDSFPPSPPSGRPASQASPAARWLDATSDRAGRVMVAEDLSVPGHDRIFAIGDTRRPADAAARRRAGRQAAGTLCRRR